MAESFFHTLKTELIYLEDFDTHEQAQTAVFEYIEVFYNRQRCHSANGYLAPLAYEQALKTNEILVRKSVDTSDVEQHGFQGMHDVQSHVREHHITRRVRQRHICPASASTNSAAVAPNCCRCRREGRGGEIHADVPHIAL